MNLTDKKMKLVGMYNALQEKIDAYGINDIAMGSSQLKELCDKCAEIERQIKEINKLLDITDD